MQALPELSAQAGDFSVEGTFDGASVTLRLRGHADLRARQVLADALAALDHEARRLAAADVAIDLRELAFINQTCWNGLLTWVSRVQALDARVRYRIRFLTDPSQAWQKRSLPALHSFGADRVSVES